MRVGDWVYPDGTLNLAQSPAPSADSSQGSPIGGGAAALAEEKLGQEIERLFDSCLNPETSIRKEGWAAAAKKLDVEVELVRAVAEVESPRGPFNRDGHPTILYERHYFHRFTDGAYDKSHPKISASTSGGYGYYSEQYEKLHEAFLLDREAALKSASWGRFQIMGSNYQAAGFDNVEDMVGAMMQSEQRQLEAFVSFVSSSTVMKKALKEKNWATFARNYNGPGYKANEYDTKLRDAYKRAVEKSKNK